LSEAEIERTVSKIVDMMKRKPIYFYDILNELRDVEYRSILLAFGRLREEKMLSRDEDGRYLLAKK